LPPLCRPRACSRSFRLGAQFRPASCRTPKQRNVATNKNPWSPSPEPATGLRNSPGCEPNAVVCRRGQPRWPTWAERRSALPRMNRPDYWLAKFSKLRIDRVRGDPAPLRAAFGCSWWRAPGSRGQQAGSLECGGLPPLYASASLLAAISAWGAILASKLACSKAAASRRTPKQRSSSPERATGLRNSPGCGPNAVVCRRGQPRWPTWAERRSALRRMTRPDYWLTKSGNLGVDRARGDPAPHKSLLLLVLCDPVEKASLSHDVLPYRRQHC
jgi:hypothetical protein